MESEKIQDQEDIGSAQLHYWIAPSIINATSNFTLLLDK